MSDEQLSNARQARRRANGAEHDRPIAGNPLRPQRGLASRDRGALAFRRTQGLVRIDERSGKLLIERDVGRSDVQVAQLDFGLGTREAHRAGRRGDVAIAVRQLKRRLARRRDCRRERHRRRSSRFDANSNAQRDDRVEHRADGAGQRDARVHRARRVNGAPSSKKARAVGLIGDVADALGARCDDVRAPRPRLFG